MIRLYPFIFILTFIITGCSFPSADDKENIIALTDIYANAFENSDKKALTYALAEDFPDKRKIIKQLEYQNLYIKDILFAKTTFTITDTSFLSKTITGKMTYDISYTKKEELLPSLTRGREMTMVFQKGRHGWKILSITKNKKSGTAVDKKLLHPLYHALDTRISALNNKDMDLFSTILSPKLPKRKAIIDDLKKSIDTFKDIVYILRSRKLIELNEQKATVTQKYEMLLTLPDGTQQKLPTMVEKLTLEPDKTSGEWRIIDGLGGS